MVACNRAFLRVERCSPRRWVSSLLIVTFIASIQVTQCSSATTGPNIISHRQTHRRELHLRGSNKSRAAVVSRQRQVEEGPKSGKRFPLPEPQGGRKRVPGPDEARKPVPETSDEQPQSTSTASIPDTTTRWYQLSHYVEKNSVPYDIIRVLVVCVLLFSVVGSVCWCIYRYCLIPCGICEDLHDSPRDFRVRDGRGAFMPLTDAMDDDVWDSASSSDEEEGYIRQHSLEDEYGEFHVKLEEKNMFRAADTYHEPKSNGHSKSIEMKEISKNSHL